MNKLKFILPLILATITLVTYRSIDTQASTAQYQFSFQDNVIYNSIDNLNSNSNSAIAATIPQQIINNTIIINNTSNISYIHYWDINQNRLTTSDILGSNANFSIPSNAYYFSLAAIKTTGSISTRNRPISFSQFQTVTVSYTSAPPAPAVPSENPTTFPNVTFIDNESINVVTGMPESNNNFMRTDLIDIGSKANLPTNFVFSGEDRVDTLNLLYPTITLYYDSNMDLIYYTGREVRDSNSNTIGTRQFVSNLISEDNLGVVPVNAKYIAYVAIKDYTGDRTTSGGQVINPIGFANFTDFQEYEFVTNLRLVKWGVQTTLAQGGGIVFFYSEYLPIGTQLETYTEDLLTDPNVAREGFEPIGFDGITIVPSDPGPFEKLVVYQQLITYTVTFLDYDGTPLGTDTVQDGFPANPPLIPTRTGYTFTGWLPPIANITGDITTVAQYTPNTYLITWNSDGTEIKANQEAHDTVILSHAPFVSKENHTLVGWKIDPTETLVTSGQLVTGPLSLTAVWQEVPTFTVTWRDPSFNTLKIEYVIESGLATAPNYDPGSGLILVGWTPDPTQPISQNTTFIAVVQTAPTQPTQPTIPSNYSPIADLFGGVIGASIGAIMTLGTIELYGITLNSLIFLFVSMSLGLWILKAIRG